MLPKEYFEFFKGLEKNNSKEWFYDNRKDYEKFVKAPFKQLVTETIQAIQSIEPDLQQDPSTAIFRINRDIRFSKDKTPYKTRLAAHISKYGKKEMGKPGLYFEISATGGGIAGGCYMPDKELLTLYRDLIMHEGADLHKALKLKAFKEKYGELQGQKNKVLPAEFKTAAEKEPLLFNKQFFYWAEVPKSVFSGPNPVKEILAYYKAGMPVHDFFERVL